MVRITKTLTMCFPVPEEYKTVPSLEMTESGGDIATITCTATLDSIPDALQDKLGLSVLFDVGGCVEYTTAVVEVSENIGKQLLRYLYLKVLKLLKYRCFRLR